ncbi:spermine/spermidine synthase domain-containing protein [Ornithinimicrobium sediminis]|uniref:spermine/spermidine synthase domain-containing protein n=1 Tax=Ornithinimicrobium sediminis TaxID=2904603 RepID=UPI001E5304CB|nr:spermidine synthase [Ornithinimicrobium sediminis]MCE0487799.1 spermidine synthase [Ornithinimicrobium sediminis]
MSRRFEELAWAGTRMGEVSLRRRLEPVTRRQVYEVKLGEEFLMSSLFTAAEEAMADLALDWLSRSGATVLVGGLGLGYTAVAALRHEGVARVDVVETLEPVVDWHRERLLPCSDELLEDARTSLVLADFFAVAAGTQEAPGLRPPYDCVLLDIDHAPDFVLDESHQGFYSPAGLTRLLDLLAPGGVFALWSDRPPDHTFTGVLDSVFDRARAEVVRFANPLTGGTSANTVYLARTSS